MSSNSNSNNKRYLTVAIPNKNNLSDIKQKSFESYDSTSSNYSHTSDISENMSGRSIENNNNNERSVFFDSSPTSNKYSNSPHTEQNSKKEASFWQKTVSSFRSYKNIHSPLKRHKSVATSSVEHQKYEKNLEETEIDPVYHLLRCAATQGKSSDNPSPSPIFPPKHMQQQTSCNHASTNYFERSRSVSGSSQYHSMKTICTDVKCPCKTPEKIPVIKKEDLGQQAKREQSIRKNNKKQQLT